MRFVDIEVYKLCTTDIYTLHLIQMSLTQNDLNLSRTQANLSGKCVCTMYV